MATTDTTTEALVDFLKSERTQCGGGVAPSRISAFEKRNGVRLPDDLRTYFRELNGTGGDYAYGIIRFWGLDECVTLANEVRSAGSRAAVIQSAYGEPSVEMEDFFVFADHLHESQLYAIRLRPESTANPVIVLDGGEPAEVATSFSDFVRCYLTTPESLRLVVD